MSLKYRSEIDGLRAIAVIAVVFNHAHASWLPSGYLGVDIFFVISGFLITQIISTQMLKGEFSFFDFYKKRAKRILPAFLFVVSITSFFAFFLFLKDDFLNYIKSLVASLLFSANLFFSIGTGYFDISSQEKPLLHIWSLSIEEQFYFVFPLILLLLIFKFKDNKQAILYSIAALIGISLLSGKLTFGLEGYYLPHVRAYELLIGALFAFLPRIRLSIAVQWILFFALILMLFVPSSIFAFGGGYVERLVICTLTGFLLLNKYENISLGILLSSKIFVFFGLISYSLYLWHWVVFSFLRYVRMESNLPVFLVLIAICISVAFAYLTYRFIENPIKNMKNFSTPTYVMSAAVYVVVVLMTIGYWYVQRGNAVYTAKTNNANLYWDTNICHDVLPENTQKCVKGKDGLNTNTLVVGDSHAGQYNALIHSLGKREEWSAFVLSANSCSYLYSEMMPLALSKNAINCNNFRNYVDSQILKYDNIILISHWQFYTEDNGKYDLNFKSKFEQTLKYLVSNGKNVYVVADNPKISYSVLRNYHLQKYFLDRKDKPIKEYSTEIANSEIKSIVDKYPTVQWVDFTSYIPDSFEIDGLPIYKDLDHFNPYGAEKMADLLIEKNYRFLNDK